MPAVRGPGAAPRRGRRRRRAPSGARHLPGPSTGYRWPWSSRPGQVRAFGPAQLAARLDARLQFANRRFDAPARQRTLRGTWWRGATTCSPRRRSACSPAWCSSASTLTVSGAAAVGAPDAEPHVAVLVDQSLLVRDPDAGGTARFRLLDTLRCSRGAMMETGGEADAGAHTPALPGVLRTARDELHGPDQAEWIDRIEAEESQPRRPDWPPSTTPRWPWPRRGPVACWVLRWRARFAIAYLTGLLDRHADVLTVETGRGRPRDGRLAANPGEVRLSRAPAQQAGALFRDLARSGAPAALIALACAHRERGARRGRAVPRRGRRDRRPVRGRPRSSRVRRRLGDRLAARRPRPPSGSPARNSPAGRRSGSRRGRRPPCGTSR